MGSNVLTVMSPESPASERALVTGARAGEQSAREELAQRAGRSAYVFALQLTGRPDVAGDVAQDSLLRFFEHLDRVDVDRPVDAWLFSIVRNQVRDRARRERVRQHESLDVWLEAGGREPAATDDPAAAAELHELQRRVWRGISELSGAHREILVLRDYHGLAYADIANVLSIPTGTVMSRLHAARKRLRDVLDESAGAARPETSTGRATHE